MKKFLLATVLASACRLPAFAADPAVPAVSTAAPVSYDYGMEQRRRGDYAGAKETFLKLLEKSPDSGGALEGLSLACISLGQFDEARGYLDRWNARSPHNTYVLGLLVRVQNAQRDDEGALDTYRDLAACDPRDCAVRRRLDSAMERLRPGVFPYGRSYKSYSMEGLDTASPQRILYEGNSAGSRFRAALKPGLDLVGGTEIREEAQRNDGRGFTYYDIQDQVYSAGLNGRPGRNFSWEAEYGQSALSDLKGEGVGNRLFSRARLGGELHAYGADFRLLLTRAPKYLRGAGGTQFFKLLGENAARAEAEAGLLGWDWLARAGLFSTSDGSNLVTYSLKGAKEAGAGVLQAGYSHGQQEFYGASASGRLAYANTDRVSAGLRRGVEDRYRASASYAYTFYSDDNHLAELDAELAGWLPWQREFYGSYRFALEDFGAPHPGYNSIDTRAHWLGAYWRRCRGLHWSALAGYERGFLHDLSRGSYEGNNYLAELEWYRGSGASVRAQARKSDTSVRDRSYSVSLQARYSFR